MCLFCICRWEFKTDGYDIGFGILYENKMGPNEEVVPVERVNSHMVPEDGTYVCKKKGTCKRVVVESIIHLSA